jgi:DNA-binding NarL/FixJ family response regulator
VVQPDADDNDAVDGVASGGVKIVIADDQELVREGLAMIIEAEDDMEVVAHAATGAEAVAAALRARPDVVLMDIRMPVLDGIAATRQLLQEAGANPPRIVILTTFSLDEYVLDALRAGASGFLLKDAPRDQLLAAIRVAARGDALISPAVTRPLIEELVRRSSTRLTPDPKLLELTAREREVLQLIGHGLSNAELAARLCVSEGTIKTHVSRILMKLGLRDRVQAVVLAYESGLISPGNAS